MRWPTGCAPTLLVLALLSGCGGGEVEPEEATGEAKQAAATVTALEQALKRHDYAQICNKVFSNAVRDQSGGGDCPAQLARTAAGVEQPVIRIRAITLKGDKAVVKVTTTASDQKPAPDEIELVREQGGWRVASLGG